MTELQKQKQRKENVLKLKKIGFWTINIISYICAFLFVILLIISLASPKQSNNTTPRSPSKIYHNDIILVDRQPNNVSYDDSHYEITLSSDEFLNYTYDNLRDLYNDNYSDFSDTSNSFYFSYNGNYVYFEEGEENDYVIYQYNDEGVQDTITFNLWDTPTYFTFRDYSNNTTPQYDIIICSNSTYYNAVKNAIELDIQANTSSPSSSIFESLTQVITNFISTLNEGVENVIELFWDSENLSLTMLGNLTTIVVGVAVCFFLFRLLIGLIRLRG